MMEPPINPSHRLEKELERIRRTLEMNEEFRVEWRPDPSKAEEGEVKGRKILIYSENESNALETLRHEVVDYLVSQTIEPYKEVANGLILLLNKQAYEKKERVIEKLSRLLTY